MKLAGTLLSALSYKGGSHVMLEDHETRLPPVIAEGGLVASEITCCANVSLRIAAMTAGSVPFAC